MKLMTLMLLLVAGASHAQTVYTIVGEATDNSNLYCSSSEKIEEQRKTALVELDRHTHMRAGICSWSGGYLRVESKPSTVFYDLNNEGCRVSISIQASCIP